MSGRFKCVRSNSLRHDPHRAAESVHEALPGHFDGACIELGSGSVDILSFSSEQDGLQDHSALDDLLGCIRLLVLVENLASLQAQGQRGIVRTAGWEGEVQRNVGVVGE